MSKATTPKNTPAKAKAKAKAPATKRTYRPSELAAEIGVDAKVLRAYLRRNHARPATAKNTSWIVPADVAAAAKAAFKKNEATK